MRPELAGPDSWHGLYRGFRDLSRVRSVGGAPQEVLGEESKHTEEISVSSGRQRKYLWGKQKYLFQVHIPSEWLLQNITKKRSQNSKEDRHWAWLVVLAHSRLLDSLISHLFHPPLLLPFIYKCIRGRWALVILLVQMLMLELAFCTRKLGPANL